MSKKYVHTEIDGFPIRLSNLQKLLYPDIGVVKAEVIAYYLKVAPYLLKYIAGRPTTLIRFPDGIHKSKFYAKTIPDWAPEWINTHEIHHSDGAINYLVIQNKACIAWTANLAGLEIHPMQMNANNIEYPDYFVLDLDPPENSTFDHVKEVAMLLKPFLTSMGFKPLIKTSGSKGLHIFVPINSSITHNELAIYTKQIAKEFVQKNKKIATLNLRKEARGNKILIDIYRNHKAQSIVAPYSLRGKPNAPISCPIAWSSLEKLKSAQEIHLRNIDDHLLEYGDVWKDWDTLKVDIPLEIFEVKKQNKKSIPKLDTSKNTIDNSAIFKVPIAPMLAESGEEIPKGKNYRYEVKWDGIRAIIKVNGDSIHIQSRSGSDLTYQFPELTKADNFNCKNGIFDGEILSLDKEGKPDFAKVISRLHLKEAGRIDRASRTNPVYCYLFDCIYLDGTDIQNQTNFYRKEKLIQSIKSENNYKISESVEDGKSLYDAVKKMNLEGIMAKDMTKKYVSGKRSEAWIKIKVRSDIECWIIGFTDGKGDRSNSFGALHLGIHVEGDWKYLGKVGTGFNEENIPIVLKFLQASEQCEKLIEDNIKEAYRTHWVIPTKKCKIRFASYTNTGTLREPVFLSLILE